MSKVNERISTKRKYIKSTSFTAKKIAPKSKSMKSLLPQYTEAIFCSYTVM